MKALVLYCSCSSRNILFLLLNQSLIRETASLDHLITCYWTDPQTDVYVFLHESIFMHILTHKAQSERADIDITCFNMLWHGPDPCVLTMQRVQAHKHTNRDRKPRERRASIGQQRVFLYEQNHKIHHKQTSETRQTRSVTCVRCKQLICRGVWWVNVGEIWREESVLETLKENFRKLQIWNKVCLLAETGAIYTLEWHEAAVDWAVSLDCLHHLLNDIFKMMVEFDALTHAFNQNMQT